MGQVWDTTPGLQSSEEQKVGSHPSTSSVSGRSLCVWHLACLAPEERQKDQERRQKDIFRGEWTVPGIHDSTCPH